MSDAKPARLTLEYLLSLLLQRGWISDEQCRIVRVKETATHQRLVKEHTSENARLRYRPSPVEVVAANEIFMTDGRRLSEDRIMEALAADTGFPYMKLDPLKLDARLITRTFSRAFARHNIVLPVQRNGPTLMLAISDPYNKLLQEQLIRTLPTKPEYVITSKTDILRFVTETYGFRSSVDAAAIEHNQTVDLGNLEQLVSLKQLDDIEATDAHIVNAVEYLLLYAFGQRASDIHIEPKRETVLVRMRIDGVLHQIYQLPKVIHPPLTSRIKMLARMDIAERRRPQDGRIKTEQNGREVEMRVSSMPVAFGEKIVIRIFDPQNLLQDLSTIGMQEEERSRYEGFLARTTGMILVTGPTGSGKTTTLYSTLQYLAGPEVNITTVEDPIEMIYDNFNQVQVHEKIGMTFAGVLRTVLRQDPDVVMVGEIRDAETATMAIQAALTGHLVLSTIHTNDAPSTITRLIDLGCQPFLIASTLIGVVAQRLLRTICPDCKDSTTLTEDQLATLEVKLPPKQHRQLPIKFGAGCATCRYTGLLGRTGVFEVMDVDATIRALINDRADAAEIMKAARADRMLTLKEGAIRKLAQGETTFEEVCRVLGH